MLLLFWHGVEAGDGTVSAISYVVSVLGDNGDTYVFSIDPNNDVDYRCQESPSPAVYSFVPVGRTLP